MAVEEKDRLAALGTFAEIEDLTAEIGDEVARQLARFELTRRAEAMTETGVHASLFYTSWDCSWRRGGGNWRIIASWLMHAGGRSESRE